MQYDCTQLTGGVLTIYFYELLLYNRINIENIMIYISGGIFYPLDSTIVSSFILCVGKGKEISKYGIADNKSGIKGLWDFS